MKIPAIIAQEHGWSRLSDVQWDIVREGIAACERVLHNPERFPRADFDAIEAKHEALLSLSLAAPIVQRDGKFYQAI